MQGDPGSALGSPEVGTGVELGPDERRVVVEAIATLAYMKQNMIDLILRPAGVPPDVYVSFLKRCDERTGRPLSKRQFAPLIIAELEQRPEGRKILRAIIRLAAHWDKFHLAEHEYEARATVQKARELLGVVEQMEAREAFLREIAKLEGVRRLEREERERLRQEREKLRTGSEYLLRMFDGLAIMPQHHERGYLLQDLLNRTFDLHSIPVIRPFTRNDGAEQIDGGFKLDGWHYIVECRWRERLADIRQLDGLLGQVQRSGKQTMGLFLSVEGWSEHVVPTLKQNPEKAIILMHGHCLRFVLTGEIGLRELVLAKLAHLNFEAEPFLGAVQALAQEAQANK
jgi:hypothetical protein